MSIPRFIPALIWMVSSGAFCLGFVHCWPLPSRASSRALFTTLNAAPKRLADNVDGVVYVNEKCINCAACSAFAPENFGYSPKRTTHIVKKQPSSKDELLDSRAAMAACPVAAIRVEAAAQHADNESKELAKQMALPTRVNELDLPFPRKLARDTWYVGYHNEHSFGAVPFLTKARHNGQDVWIMVDTPRFGKPALGAVESLTGPDGPDYMVLTHVDDTSDHDKWAQHYPGLKRVFHANDAYGRANWVRDSSLQEVEVLLPRTELDSQAPLGMFDLDGNQLNEKDASEMSAVIYHTPGHTAGSICLMRHDLGIIFTGDTLAWSTRLKQLTGFPRYNKADRELQSKTLEKMGKLDWSLVAAGHGHVRDYGGVSEVVRQKELRDARKELEEYARVGQ